MIQPGGAASHSASSARRTRSGSKYQCQPLTQVPGRQHAGERVQLRRAIGLRQDEERIAGFGARADFRSQIAKFVISQDRARPHAASGCK